MVLAIKLRDNIFVPFSASEEITFGNDYFQAQNIIQNILSYRYGSFVNTDELSFNEFLPKILKTFKPTLAYNLYYMAESLKISSSLDEKNNQNSNLLAANPSVTPEMLLPIENYLNYLGFEINKEPTSRQLKVLETLKGQTIIEQYWLEGETRQMELPKNISPIEPYLTINITDSSNTQFFIAPPQNLQNEYSIDLELNRGFESNQGLGTTIIIFEQTATNKFALLQKKVNMQHLKRINGTSLINSIGQVGASASDHQISTLATIFGNTETGTNQVQGLAPKAKLVVSSLKDVQSQNHEGVDNHLDIEFVENKHKILSILRKVLVDLDVETYKNAIFLFEIETWVPTKKITEDMHLGLYFPVFVISDIVKQINSLTKTKKMIFVGGAGNYTTNFDKKSSNLPWKLLKYDYVDLTKDDSQFLMIGAAQKNRNGYKVHHKSNFCKNMGAYLYTDYNLGENIGEFGGTSGASAIAAGIITNLQGEAIKNGTPLTTKIIREVFNRTFMHKRGDYPKNVLTPKTLAELWTVCQQVMREEAQPMGN